MGLFERYLSIWVGLAILAGMGLGQITPETFQWVARQEYAHVNLIIGVLIWLMIYPMMVQVDFSAIKDVGKNPRGLVLTLIINWLVKPFTMAFLGWLFFKVIFAPLVDPQTASEYIAGMILLGVAPCTAMVFVWSQLTKGDANYTLVQVSINDVVMIFAFAPLVAFLLGVTEISVPWDTLLLSVVLYVLIPLMAGMLTRRLLNRISREAAPPVGATLASNQAAHPQSDALNQLLARLKPWSILGLLLTVLVLFGLQSNTILDKPIDIVLIAIPLILQTYGIFAIAYVAAKKLRLPHAIAAPACLIGTSNFFELAVAVAISLFGLNSGAALATVVGVLVEVPVMLSLVWFANSRRAPLTAEIKV